MENSLAQAWSRITVPVSGATEDVAVLEAAATLAQAFSGQLNVIFAPPDPAELAPWLGEGFMGTVQISALDGLKAASEEGELLARAHFDAVAYQAKSFAVLQSPVWEGLSMETRLSDLVVFGDHAARGQGLLSEAFQQVLMEERAGVFVARRPLDVAGTAVVAWDGKEPSSRAARRAVALLKKAAKVVVTGMPSGEYPADLSRLAAYYAAHGIEADIDVLPKGDVVAQLMAACERHGADYLVAGAFGRSRLREFAFGGTTRALLHNTQINLYMAH